MNCVLFRFERVFSWKSFAFLVIFGGGYLYIIESVKKEKLAEAAKEQNKIIGQASLGGDWELTRLDGTKGGSQDLRGNFGLIYFGFTHCPGYCNSFNQTNKEIFLSRTLNLQISISLLRYLSRRNREGDQSCRRD